MTSSPGRKRARTAEHDLGTGCEDFSATPCPVDQQPEAKQCTKMTSGQTPLRINQNNHETELFDPRVFRRATTGIRIPRPVRYKKAEELLDSEETKEGYAADAKGMKSSYIQQTFGVDPCDCVDDRYLDHEAWIADQRHVVLELTADVSFVMAMRSNVVEMGGQLPDQDGPDDGCPAVINPDEIFPRYSHELIASMDGLPRKTRLSIPFTTFQVLNRIYEVRNDRGVPWRVVTPDALKSETIKSAMESGSVQRLNLGQLDTHYFETGVRIANLIGATAAGDVLLKTAAARLNAIEQGVIETLTSEGCCRANVIPNDQHLIRTPQPADDGPVVGVGRAAMLGKRRGSVIRSVDDQWNAFQETFTVTERAHFCDTQWALRGGDDLGCLLQRQFQDIANRTNRPLRDVLGLDSAMAANSGLEEL